MDVEHPSGVLFLLETSLISNLIGERRTENMSAKSINNGEGKPIYKQWWFWVIIVVILAIIGFATQGAESNNTDTGDKTDNSSNVTQTDTFNSDFDSLCNKLKDAYKTTGQVSCQDANTWTQNHAANADAFPYEYRDINIDFNGQIAYEIKVVKDVTNMDYFKKDYTCANIYGGDGNCVVGEAKDNMLYSVIFTDKNDQKQADNLASGLKTILEQ